MSRNDMKKPGGNGNGKAVKEMQTTERPKAAGTGPGAELAQKPHNFLPSAKRLFGLLRAQLGKVIFVIATGVMAGARAAVGPRGLRRATDPLFGRLIEKPLPAGRTREPALEGA